MTSYFLWVKEFDITIRKKKFASPLISFIVAYVAGNIGNPALPVMLKEYLSGQYQNFQ